jgi:hypothetical protein
LKTVPIDSLHLWPKSGWIAERAIVDIVTRDVQTAGDARRYFAVSGTGVQIGLLTDFLIGERFLLEFVE